MRYTRSNFKKWLQKMPPRSRPFPNVERILEEVGGIAIDWPACPIAAYLGLRWNHEALGVDSALASAIDRACDEDYAKLTPRKILSIIKRLEK